ncbi:hypothetical protein OH76DRAFT_1472454, partial [Lentinus brumalis]
MEGIRSASQDDVPAQPNNSPRHAFSFADDVEGRGVQRRRGATYALACIPSTTTDGGMGRRDALNAHPSLPGSSNADIPGLACWPYGRVLCGGCMNTGWRRRTSTRNIQQEPACGSKHCRALRGKQVDDGGCDGHCADLKIYALGGHARRTCAQQNATTASCTQTVQSGSTRAQPRGHLTLDFQMKRTLGNFQNYKDARQAAAGGLLPSTRVTLGIK